MKKSDTLGYIVIRSDIGLQVLGKDNSLWKGRSVTLFPTENDAEKAIARTDKQEEEGGFDWTKLFGSLEIRRVVSTKFREL